MEANEAGVKMVVIHDRRRRLELRRNQMSKSAAVVTGASQGFGRSTAIRLVPEFSALLLVARNGANLDG
jgi:hypothetical protein